MRKHLAMLALTALMAGIATSAHAQGSWYVRGDLGYSVGGQLDTSFEVNDEEELETRPQSAHSGGKAGPQALTISQSFDFEDDWMFDAAVGHGYDNGFRAEVELARRDNDISNTTVDAQATSLMINGYYDFNRGGRFQPYVGLGVGYAKVDINNDDDSNFAWQAMAGVGVPVNQNLTLDLGYRFMSVDDLDFSGLNADYEHQAVTLGVRYQFGAPPPPPLPPQPPTPPTPPTPPPPVCPTSEFTVYFEWDRADLNQAALEVIDQAIARAAQCNTSAVAVVGHTDTSGSTRYNAGLSERRAGVVRDALVARGIAATAITAQGRGETELARQTRDGVREPLNRRTAVTITFH